MVDFWSILLIGLAGGVLPLLVRWNERHLHTALALSTGIFLGAVFLHFLPTLSTMSLATEQAPTEASAEAPQDHDHDHAPGEECEDDHAEAAGAGVGAADGHAGHAHGGDRWLWLFVLVGVLGVYLIEALVLRTHDHDERHRHRAVGYAALLGLTVHALTAGIGFSAAKHDLHAGRAIFVAILAHKGFEAFSLTTVFQLAKISRAKVLLLVIAFACVTPAGMLAGDALSSVLGPRGLPLLTALAAGTFLYVCLCELLVEVFHHREDTLVRVALLAAGIALTVVFEGIEHG